MKLNEKVGTCKRHGNTREIRQWCTSTERGEASHRNFKEKARS